MQVAAILSAKGTDVATVPPTASVSEALAMLQSWGVGALVVSGDGRAIDGLISERDVVRGLVESGAGLLDRPVTEAMSTEVHTCTLTQSADDLMTTMTELRVRHLPVLDHDGALGGIISIGDVVKCRVGELEDEQAQLIDYVRQGR
jgi:CBS domain-containing protein